MGLLVSIQNQIVEVLLKLLLQFYEDMNEEYLRKCEKNFLADTNIFTATKIYIRLIDSGKIEPLKKEESEKLINMIFMNLLRFKRIAAEKVIKQGIEGKSPENITVAPGSTSAPPKEKEKEKEKEEDIYEKLITNEIYAINYYSELETRLNIFRHVFIKQKPILRPEAATFLWQIFLLNSLSSREAKLFFGFMDQILTSDHGSSLIIDGVFDSFLLDFLLKIDSTELTVESFNCLLRMTFTLNSYYRHIRAIKSSVGGIEYHDLKQLLGFSNIWDAAIFAKVEAVQKKAAEQLQGIYRKLSPDLIQSSGNEIKEALLLNCMKHIKEGFPEGSLIPPSNDMQMAVLRSLGILQNYLDEIESGRSAAELRLQKSPEYMIEIKVPIPGPIWKGQVSVGMKMTELLTYLHKVKELNGPIEKYIFVNKGKHLKPSDLTLYDSGIIESNTIMIQQE